VSGNLGGELEETSRSLEVSRDRRLRNEESPVEQKPLVVPGTDKSRMVTGGKGKDEVFEPAEEGEGGIRLQSVSEPRRRVAVSFVLSDSVLDRAERKKKRERIRDECGDGRGEEGGALSFV